MNARKPAEVLSALVAMVFLFLVAVACGASDSNEATAHYQRSTELIRQRNWDEAIAEFHLGCTYQLRANSGAPCRAQEADMVEQAKRATAAPPPTTTPSVEQPKPLNARVGLRVLVVPFGGPDVVTGTCGFAVAHWRIAIGAALSAAGCVVVDGFASERDVDLGTRGTISQEGEHYCLDGLSTDGVIDLREPGLHGAVIKALPYHASGTPEAIEKTIVALVVEGVAGEYCHSTAR